MHSLRELYTHFLFHCLKKDWIFRAASFSLILQRGRGSCHVLYLSLHTPCPAPPLHPPTPPPVPPHEVLHDLSRPLHPFPLVLGQRLPVQSIVLLDHQGGLVLALQLWRRGGEGREGDHTPRAMH